MAEIHTNIPSSVLPIELAALNQITTEYESFALIPKLGPLSYTYYRRQTRKTIYHIIQALDLIKLSSEYLSRWKVLPIIPVQVLSTPEILKSANSPQVIDFDALLQVNFDIASANMKELSFNSGQPTKSLMSERSLNIFTSAVTKGSAVKSEEVSEKKSSLQHVLSIVSESNPVIRTLSKSGYVLTKDGVVSEKLIEMDIEKRMSLVFSELINKKTKVPKLVSNMAMNLVDREIETDIQNLGDAGIILQKNTDLRANLHKIVAERLELDRVIDSIPSLDDSVITDSREWAFIRKERVVLELKTPYFRGPISLNSVAPKSELLLSQGSTSSSEQVTSSLKQQSSKLSGNNVISRQIKENFGTLYDYGSNLGQTMSEEGFSKDTSQGLKRTIVEASLNEISQANSDITISRSNQSKSVLREYRTEGKDPKFSTSEVAFEAITPVTATHYLDGIGAVWCPRIRNPYHHLKATIRAYAQRVESDYIKENYVIDPLEPIPTYEGFERISKDAIEVKNGSIEDDVSFTEEVVIALSNADKAQGYYLSNDVVCKFHQDDDFWTNAFESDQYEIRDPVILEHVENSHIKIQVTLRIIEESTGRDPHSVGVSVSVSKFKYTQSYLDQMKDYTSTISDVNPARRAAVKVQAKKYSRLKKEELIKKYETNIRDMTDFTFVSLMKKMFSENLNNHQWSYYQGIIKSCVDWERAKIEPEPASADNLSAEGLSPYHFLNVNAVRFFLPLHEGSEDAFFDAVSHVVDSDWSSLFEEVNDYITRQRDIVKLMRNRMNDEDIAQLQLDTYDSELLLGRHLESVLSKHEFSAS